MAVIGEPGEGIAHGEPPQPVLRFLALPHDRRQHEGHEGGRALKRLEQEQRLVERRPGERTIAAQRAQDGDG